MVLLTHSLSLRGFGKSLRALDLHVLNDVVVVLLTLRFPQQGLAWAQKFACLNDVNVVMLTHPLSEQGLAGA